MQSIRLIPAMHPEMHQQIPKQGRCVLVAYKQKHNLKKDLDSVNNQSMGDLSFSTKFELFNQVGENLDLTDYVLSQT